MIINFANDWQPKGPSTPKVDEESYLLLYQDRIANRNKNFRSEDFVFTPRNKFGQ